MINFANDFMHTGVTSTNDRDLGDDIFSTIGGSGSRAENCLTQIKTFFPMAEHEIDRRVTTDDAGRSLPSLLVLKEVQELFVFD